MAWVLRSNPGSLLDPGSGAFFPLQVRGWIFLQGCLVQVASGFCTSDGESGVFQLRGSMCQLHAENADVLPEDDGAGLSVDAAEARGTQSLASTAGTMADMEHDYDLEAACTDPKAASPCHASKL